MGSPYKMKGSPMQRNFGVGVSNVAANKKAGRDQAIADENNTKYTTPKGIDTKSMEYINTYDSTILEITGSNAKDND